MFVFVYTHCCSSSKSQSHDTSPASKHKKSFRKFYLKKIVNLELSAGDLVMISGLFQDGCEHYILPGAGSGGSSSSFGGGINSVRYNLIFRIIRRYFRKCPLRAAAADY